MVLTTTPAAPYHHYSPTEKNKSIQTKLAEVKTELDKLQQWLQKIRQDIDELEHVVDTLQYNREMRATGWIRSPETGIWFLPTSLADFEFTRWPTWNDLEEWSVGHHNMDALHLYIRGRRKR